MGCSMVSGPQAVAEVREMGRREVASIGSNCDEKASLLAFGPTSPTLIGDL